MFLDFYKASEDASTVSYWVKTNAYEKTSAGVITTPVKALCTFNKIIKKMSFDPEKTDSFFFERRDERLMIEIHLNEISKKQKGFPDEYYVCTGG